MNNSLSTSTQRTVWLDVARLLAFLLLLGCHATDPINAAATYGSSSEAISAEDVAWGTLWGSFVRPCVPLFVMLTGALLLPTSLSMKAFYQRRIPRVLWPFLLWCVLYYLTPWFTGLLGADSSMVTYLFSWAESDSQSLTDGIGQILRIPLTFPYLASHMWYIYLLIGLYLFMPILSAWVATATRREKEWVLLLWAFSTSVPYITEFLSPYAFGTCSWNSFGTFYYFAGFNGYLLLGHYVSRYIQWSTLKTVVISLPLIAIGFIISHYGYQAMVSKSNPTPEQVELFWTYCTPNVAMMSLGWLLLCKRINTCSARLQCLLENLTLCGFGIYMAHYFFVRPCHDIVTQLHLPTPLRIPSAAVLLLLVSWTIVWLLRKVLGKHARYVVG